MILIFIASAYEDKANHDCKYVDSDQHISIRDQYRVDDWKGHPQDEQDDGWSEQQSECYWKGSSGHSARSATFDMNVTCTRIGVMYD